MHGQIGLIISFHPNIIHYFSTSLSFSRDFLIMISLFFPLPLLCAVPGVHRNFHPEISGPAWDVFFRWPEIWPLGKSKRDVVW